MYPYHWQWTYTVLAVVLLLVPFALAGVALLRRSLSSRRRLRHTPTSISTPYGHISYSDIRTQKMIAPGVARARQREYHVKGRE